MQSLSRHPIQSIQNPFTHSINPSYPSPPGQYLPYNYHNNFVNVQGNHKNSLNQSVPRYNEPTETLNLNDQVSFARNFKSRLYESDPQQQMNKQKVQDKYREELRIQMEDDRRRKLAQKAKDEEYDIKLEKKFYQDAKIEAQKKSNKNEEPNYFVMRTAKGKRKHPHKIGKGSPESQMNNSELMEASRTQEIVKSQGLRRTLYGNPKIIKRGGYHNQSSLDQPRLPSGHQFREVPRQVEHNNPQQRIQASYNPSLQVKTAEEQIFTRQLLEQQDRISKLMLFQQNMLKKLDYFRKQIYETSHALKLGEEYEKVKLKLRAKPINMQKVHSLSVAEGVDDLLDDSELYRLPIVSKNRKIYEGQREARKKKVVTPINLKDLGERIEAPEQKKQIILVDKQDKPRQSQKNGNNDKNFALPESEIQPEESELLQQASPVRESEL